MTPRSGGAMLLRRALLAAPLAAAAVGAARAQTSDGYPKNPVRFIIPSAPGGPTDVMARMIAPGLTAKLGQSVLIINRPGAGGNIGVVQVAKSPPDGYTLLIASTGFVVNPSLYREAGYDPFKDFLPITELGASPNVILVHPSSNITSLAQPAGRDGEEGQEQAQHHQSGTGLDAASHRRAAAAARRDRYREHPTATAPGPAIAALLGKTTPVGITALPPAHAQIKSGALRAIAITGAERWFDLPDVPTLKESGFPDLVSETFQGMYAPAGTPADIVRRVAHDTLEVLGDPVVIGKLRDVGFDVRASGPDGLRQRVRKEVPLWHDVIVKSGMELQ